MSYSIVYNRQFLRVGDKIIPLTLIGSSNLWETNGYGKSQRRARHWNSMMNSLNTVPLMTAEEIMDEATSWTGGEYQEHFKWHSKWVDDKALLSFCKNGVKNAATLEELKDRSHYPEAVYIRCYLSVWFTDGTTYSDGSLRQKNTSEMSRRIHSTADLLSFMDEAALRIAAKKPNEDSIYVCVEFSGENVVEHPKEIRKRKPAERLASNFWVVQIHQKSGLSYFVKKLTRHLYYTTSADYAKQFQSRAAAEKWVAGRNILKRFDGISECSYEHVA